MANNVEDYINTWFGDIYCSNYGNAWLPPNPMCKDTASGKEIRLGQFLGKVRDIKPLFEDKGIAPLGKENIFKIIEASSGAPLSQKIF